MQFYYQSFCKDTAFSGLAFSDAGVDCKFSGFEDEAVAAPVGCADLERRDINLVRFLSYQVHMIAIPNKVARATRRWHLRSAVAVHVAVRRCPSFLR